MRCSLGTQGGSAPSGIACIEIATLSQLVRLLFYATKHPVTWGAKEGAVIAENLLQNANRRFINAAAAASRCRGPGDVKGRPLLRESAKGESKGKDEILHWERGQEDGGMVAAASERQTDSGVIARVVLLKGQLCL